MAISSCNKEVATRLFRMLAVNEQTVTTVKSDHASYAKFSLLTQQVVDALQTSWQDDGRKIML